jgi:1-acyl-sn-glycerol-3-phosphate acyltransferase
MGREYGERERPGTSRAPHILAADMPAITSAGTDDRAPWMYRAAMRACWPIVRIWGRLETDGLEYLPSTGPVLLACNHDSYWDPVAVGVAALERRQIRALAKASMWDIPGLSSVLTGMGQIPIKRGKADSAALSRAIDELRGGACIGIFPEGTRSLGRELRARGGIGRLAEAVPEARIVSCAVVGAGDIARFPKRPRVRVRFFEPAGGGLGEAEGAGVFAARLLSELRASAPIDAAGRHHTHPSGGSH